MGYKAGMLAVAIATAMTGSAQAATEYPSGASQFVGDTEGWAGSDTSCTGGVGSICTASTVYEPSVGNPPGSISMRTTAVANAAGTFTAAGTWTSPAFTVPAGHAVTGATFSYDRQLAAGGLLALEPESTVTVELVDVTAGSSSTLLSEGLTVANASFATAGAGVPAGKVVDGHTYRLRIVTTTTTNTASIGVVGQENTRFDNVVLAVEQSAGGGDGGTTPIVSEGVTVVKSFRSTTEIAALFKRFDENTEVGRGPGGSLIPLDLCTIVGTAGADRITGTRGNDVICGLGGNDVIDGAGGIDIIDGANGNDRLSGGSGKDKLIGLRGRDRLNGNAGNDAAGGGAGRDRVAGAAGSDRLGGGKGRDRILGGAGKDRLLARDRTRDTVDGGKGRDRATVDRLARGARRTKAAARRTDRVLRVERRR
jgi:Ca2+-binding RTX toxin-like protein